MIINISINNQLRILNMCSNYFLFHHLVGLTTSYPLDVSNRQWLNAIHTLVVSFICNFKQETWNNSFKKNIACAVGVRAKRTTSLPRSGIENIKRKERKHFRRSSPVSPKPHLGEFTLQDGSRSPGGRIISTMLTGKPTWSPESVSSRNSGGFGVNNLLSIQHIGRHWVREKSVEMKFDTDCGFTCWAGINDNTHGHACVNTIKHISR